MTTIRFFATTALVLAALFAGPAAAPTPALVLSLITERSIDTIDPFSARTPPPLPMTETPSSDAIAVPLTPGLISTP